jgi:gliding motility-associated-like protein
MDNHPLIIVLLLFCTSAAATHNRAGQIIYKHVSGNTYEFTVTTFTYTLSAADRPQLDISWGDNTVSIMDRDASLTEMLPDNYKKNTYIIRHTYPGSGVYTIVVEDPNRNLGVENIPNSVSVVFSIKTIFRIDPNLGANNAPELLTYPIDKAALGQVFIHNPSAFDVDGDSLSYELTICTRDRGVEIENYSLPEASDSLVVNAITGDLIWASPTKVGIYNVAIKINEWRHGVKIGSIARDMQIEVVDSKNRPPIIEAIPPRCVEAGTKIDFAIRATDPDNDRIELTATGGPFGFDGNKATFEITGSGNGYTQARFVWQTDDSHVRKQPYAISVKAEDQNTEIKLVNFVNFSITVLAPKIENLTAIAEKKHINLSWLPAQSAHAAGYEIYRSVGHNAVNPDSCLGGIPADSGYEKVATLAGINHIAYMDDNEGKGLSPGIEYCYRVVAYFADGARSFPSDEACNVLLAGTPPMILADVATIDPAGEIVASWLRKPLTQIISGKPGPFEYRLFYTENRASDAWTLLYTTPTPNTVLQDTSFVHTVDTKGKHSHYYKVELWNRESGAEYLLDEDVEIASTLYPGLQPSDRSVLISFERYAPWLNTEYTIYRCLNTADCIPVDSVGFTDKESYLDTGLENGQTYCYRIRSRGYRKIDDIRYENENRSHVACVTPYDNVPPCAPELTGKSICEENRNQLDWTYPTLANCTDDVVKYRIFYSVDRVQPYLAIDSTDRQSFSHNETVVGCYYITATDAAGNESAPSNIVCLDECGNYNLPNVFSPNGDNINDVFKSFNPAGISKVDMKIFNRWGKLVFKTTSPDINWDGRDIDSKRFVPTGVYYYVCDVYEERLTGTQTKTLAGFIHLYVGSDAKPYSPPEK